MTEQALDRLGAVELRTAVRGYRDALRAHQERLNRLNVYPVPDGDTGTNMALTLESVVAELGDADDMTGVCRAISHGSLMGARGNSGVILSQILRGLTDRLKGVDGADGAAVADALESASTAAYQAVMRPVEGTIITVAREAAEAAQLAAKEPDATLDSVLAAAEAAGADALRRTPELLPVLAEAGVVDAGGAGFLLFLDVLRNVVNGADVPQPSDEVDVAPRLPVAPAGTGVHGTVSDLRYEVMFLLETPDDARVDGFKQAWAAVGDSIVVVGGDGLYNCHIHTDDIGTAIEAGIEVGRPHRIRVTDLAEQVEEERWVREGSGGPAPPRTGTAAIAVASGEGVVEILRSLGVTEVVAGGPSMNPSTAEVLAAINAVGAAEVVLLPNDRNVVAVAERAAQVASQQQRPTRVVPTTSVAEGFAALMGFDATANAAANAAAMAASAADVSWGEVTWAVRDASTPAGPVKDGDHLGLLGHDIVSASPDLATAACELLDRLVTPDHELVMVVEGAGATAGATEAIRQWLGEHRPAAAVEVHAGGQPLASYLFSAE